MTRSLVSALLLAVLAFALDARPAYAQQGQDAATSVQLEGTLDRDMHRKIKRLRIAGWSFFTGAGIALASIGIMQAVDDRESDAASGRFLGIAVGVGMTSAALLTVGGALLLRARLILWRHEREHDESLSLELRPTGAAVRWTF